MTVPNEVYVALSTLAGALIVKLVAFDGAKVANALSAKLAADAQQGIAAANATNNVLLREMVLSAMQYAEVHEKDLLAQFHDKAEYVIHAVSLDPRFGGLGVGLEAIEHEIEVIYTQFFAQIEAPAEPPADAAH